MYLGKLLCFMAVCGVCCSANFALAAIQYDQSVTTNAIWGSGNSNGGFTTDRNSSVGIELGLRAHVRYPVPNDSIPNGIKSNGDGTYGSFDPTGYTSGGATGGTRASWNMDWSINSNYNGAGANLNDFTYTLELDFDPGVGTNYQSAYGSSDPVNGPLWADHSFGNNSTAQGAGVEAPFPNTVTYSSLIGSSNLVQNSSNLDFEDTILYPFDPTADGIYSFRLSAYRGGDLLAQSSIDVIVGDGVVPEPATILVWTGIATCAGLAYLRKQRSA